jgi:hypothetical protein
MNDWPDWAVALVAIFWPYIGFALVYVVLWLVFA